MKYFNRSICLILFALSIAFSQDASIRKSSFISHRKFNPSNNSINGVNNLTQRSRLVSLLQNSKHLLPPVDSTSTTFSNPDDIYWDDRFGYAGLAGDIFSVATSGSNIYVGGYFSNVPSSTTVGIGLVKWNGTKWSTISLEFDGGISKIIEYGGNIYVCGNFTHIGSVPARGIAVWNGVTWSSVGGGVHGSVSDFEIVSSNIYVGGSFDSAGTIRAENVAIWNGSVWSTVGYRGIYGDVWAIEISGNNIYVGGDPFYYYDSTGYGYELPSPAKWDGTAWSPLGSGIEGTIISMKLDGSTLYVGGMFDYAGTVYTGGFAKWNGSVWSKVGSVVYGIVSCVAQSGTNIIIGGEFDQIGGSSINNIAKWSGTSWSKVGTGVEGIVFSIASNGTNLYFGGECNGTLDIPTPKMLYGFGWWNGAKIQPLLGTGNGLGLNDGVNTIAFNGSNICVGGIFTHAGNSATNYIAQFDGSNWTSLGTGVNNGVCKIVANGNDLYVGGYFTTAGGLSAKGIAKWNGSNWSTLGSGVDGSVYSIAINGSNIYVGGTFTTAGGITVNNIAMWNGSSWNALGGGVSHDYYTYVNDIVVIGSDVFACGNFKYADGIKVNQIARWDGTAWYPLGKGMTNVWSGVSINKMIVKNGELYAVGRFDSADGLLVNNIAKWNGTTWYPVGNGIGGNISEYFTWSPTLNSIAISGNDIYVAGNIFNYDFPAQGIAKWNGEQWSGLGSGTGYYDVYDLVIRGNDLYAGGGFKKAGDKSSWYLAHWSGINTFYPNPPSLNFGEVNPGNSKVDSIIIKNLGASPLIITDVNSPCGEYVFSPLQATIPAGDSVIFHVTFTPQDSGIRICEVEFSHNGLYSPYLYTTSNQERINTPISVTSRWNLVSVPLIVSDYSKQTLFPNSVSDAFAFNNGYSPQTVLENGRGYWLKFNYEETYRHYGYSTSPDYFAVHEGWNLIGSIANPLNVSSIISSPSEIIASPFYRYTSGYQVADTLFPGKGYWVKSNQAGDIILTNSLVKNYHPSDGNNLSAFNTLTITDADANNQTLYFGVNKNVSTEYRNQFALPPLPPQGIFDARFSTQNLLELVDPATSSEIPLQISSARYPLFISWNIKTSSLSSILVIDGKETNMEIGGSIQITKPESQIRLKITDYTVLPSEFALGQNYPNPFNPSTIINYQIPALGTQYAVPVSLKIYNTLGQEIAILVNDMQDAGFKSVIWTPANFPSGIYYYRLTAGTYTNTKKLILMK